MKRIVLAGNAVTADILDRYLAGDPRYEVVGFVVDEEFMDKGMTFDRPTIPLSDVVGSFPPSEHSIIMAMGYSNVNEDRRSMFERLKGLGYAIETYVHPEAMVHSNHPIGEGSIVLPGSVVEPHVHVGANTVIWCNVTVAHHAVAGDHCWIASGAVLSGKATIGYGCFIGVNATIVNGVNIGDQVIVGAGALITKDAKASTVHLARSAEKIRFSAQEYARHFGI
ncbi:MAG TPA: acetyltransferase [Microvirga sp.]|jgi:sugar O-acyltransferase (sialic acid O-acetyltransferase NeuD family)